MVTITPEKECKDNYTEFVVWRYGLEFLFQTKIEYGKGKCNLKSVKKSRHYHFLNLGMHFCSFSSALV